VTTTNRDMVPAATLRELVVARSMPVRVRAADAQDGGDTLGRLTVNFSKFDTWYRIDSWWEGTFLERVARGAFTKTMKERGPDGNGSIICLFDHGYDFHIGDKVLAVPDRMAEDGDFAVLEGDLLDTSYNRDLEPALRRGAYGSSFMFNVIRDSWDHEPAASKNNPDALPERTIEEVRLFEAGPVTWPANPAATAEFNSARSDTDRMYALMERTQPTSVAGLRKRIMDLRTAPGQQPAGPATGSPTAAATDSTRPADSHQGDRSRAARAARLRELRLPR
jgi:HK97 family phage prohead protease